MSMNDIVELLTKKIKVPTEFPLDREALTKGFIESLKVIQSGKVPEEDITEVAKIVSELLSFKDDY